MASGNETVSNCDGYEEYKRLGEWFVFAGNYIVGPITFALAIFGHALCLLIFRRQLKQGEPAYVYQLFLSTATLLSVTHNMAFMLTYHFWSGIYTTYADWFVHCYPCMFYAAHCVTAISNFFITLEVILAVSMAGDRVFALSKPMVYRNIDHKQHQITALVSCLFISVFTGAFDIRRNYIAEENGGKFKLVYNASYMNGLGALLFQFTAVVRFILLISLLFFNAATAYLYRTRIVARAVNMFERKSEARRRRRERALTVLCIWQATIYSFAIGRSLIAYLLFYVSPKAYWCGDVAAYSLYMIAWWFKAVDFYIILIVSKQFRRITVAAIPFLKRIHVNRERSSETKSGGAQTSRV